MRYDHSYGVAPLKMTPSGWQVFLVQHQSGHWTLPKGHPEGRETSLDCAKRELFEETHLTIVKLLVEKPLTEVYYFTSRGKTIHKTVDYFIAEVTGEEKIQIEELQDGKWLTFDGARALATYPQMKDLLSTVERLVKENT